MSETTSPPLAAQILEALRAKPGQKAEGIAHQLGCQRNEVNHLLHGHLKNRVRQDRSYRWYLLDGGQQVAEKEAEQFANTDLARLARYYLACLGYDDTFSDVAGNGRLTHPAG